MDQGRVAVLLAAGAAAWEAPALRELEAAGPGIVLAKRCVDLPDLLASAGTGAAQVALVWAELPGLDADSIAQLARSGVAAVVVTERGDQDGHIRLHRMGARRILPASLDSLRSALVEAAASETISGPVSAVRSGDLLDAPAGDRGRLTVVWGPRGAPGRTTVAVGLAAELARRRQETLLVDADAYGGAVAQHLGVLDQVSGLLASARLANTGQLDPERLTTAARSVRPELSVLTGLPRADRWVEVRDSAFERLLDMARSVARHVVVDTAANLEEEPDTGFGSAAPRRNGMTLTALDRGDEVVVVGAADPVGLARLARGLVELVEAVPGVRLRVVVNRNRKSLGWDEREVRAMVEGFAGAAEVHFLPEDRAAADRALVAGQALAEQGDSALQRAIAALVNAITGSTGQVRSGRRGRRAKG